MADIPQTIEQIDAHISTVRENLRQLVEQAASFSGAADDDLVSERIAEQETQLDTLMKQRERLALDVSGRKS
jgi:hypothetical protein